MKQLILYSKPNCNYCTKAKAFLKENQIDYTEINVMEDAASLAKIKEDGHRTLPVLYADDKPLIRGGYDTLKTMRREEILERLR